MCIYIKNFRILSLELFKHKILNNVKVDFIENESSDNAPFTTLIIGPNGTGKSEILRALIQIFRELEYEKFGKKFNSEYKYILIYDFNGNQFKIIKREGTKKDIYRNDSIIDISDLQIPSKILASTFILNDKFIFPKNTKFEKDSAYEYLGIRTQRGAAGTRSYLRKLVDNIVNSFNNPYFLENLKETFSFLNLKEELTISYHPKFRSYLFTGNLTIKDMDDVFINWKKRRKSEPFSYKRYIHLPTEEKNKIVNFINNSYSRIKKSGRSYFFEYHIDFEKIETTSRIIEDFEYITKLKDLDILEFPNIGIVKDVKYDLQESSSGEYHFLSTVMMILSKLEKNSLILIDEPENSFHPNWQIKYVESLKKIFSKYHSCHFIIATHSHFMISDLREESSSIVSLNRNDRGEIISILHEQDTFGWSSENILYNVFNMRTVRNYYLGEELRELLHLISSKSTDINQISKLISKFEELVLNDDDPLITIIQKADRYLGDLREND